MYITIDKQTGKVLATYETGSESEPSISLQAAETTLQIKIDKKDLPGGQLTGRKKVNLDLLKEGELVFEIDETQVVPIDFSTLEGKQKLKAELSKPKIAKLLDK